MVLRQCVVLRDVRSRVQTVVRATVLHFSFTALLHWETARTATSVSSAYNRSSFIIIRSSGNLEAVRSLFLSSNFHVAPNSLSVIGPISISHVHIRWDNTKCFKHSSFHNANSEWRKVPHDTRAHSTSTILVRSSAEITNWPSPPTSHALLYVSVVWIVVKTTKDAPAPVCVDLESDLHILNFSCDRFGLRAYKITNVLYHKNLQKTKRVKHGRSAFHNFFILQLIVADNRFRTNVSDSYSDIWREKPRIY